MSWSNVRQFQSNDLHDQIPKKTCVCILLHYILTSSLWFASIVESGYTLQSNFLSTISIPMSPSMLCALVYRNCHIFFVWNLLISNLMVFVYYFIPVSKLRLLFHMFPFIGLCPLICQYSVALSLLVDHISSFYYINFLFVCFMSQLCFKSSCDIQGKMKVFIISFVSASNIG